ncbi:MULTISPECIES: hypothetical protein [Arthrobacter]|uniref:Uncharacterized protein n=2 Tax=Arthrobacter TaxID=1663 RepID=A0ABU9KP64_9MICC|nr:hypothetical protein [Arthrobacter sp. YJM1]MDP5228622.1 hypothetical protein [Arthrobacter sp. YJM1]
MTNPFALPKRAWLATGSLLGTFSLATTALPAEHLDIIALGKAGAGHEFNLQIAGSATSPWAPAESDWAEGNPTALTIGGTPDGAPLRILPGESRTFQLAVRNAAPRLASSLRLRLYQPDQPAGTTDLFPALTFTLNSAGRILAAGQGPLTAEWPAHLSPGEVQHFELTVQLPATAGNEFNGAATQLGLRADGASR